MTERVRSTNLIPQVTKPMDNAQSSSTVFAGIDPSLPYFTNAGKRNVLPQLERTFQVIKKYNVPSLTDGDKSKIAQAYLWLENPSNILFLREITGKSHAELQRELVSTLEKYDENFRELDTIIQKQNEENVDTDEANILPPSETLEEQVLRLVDSRLTDREREVVALAKQGISNRGIAGSLGISDRRVETIMSHARSKIECALDQLGYKRRSFFKTIIPTHSYVTIPSEMVLGRWYSTEERAKQHRDLWSGIRQELLDAGYKPLFGVVSEADYQLLKTPRYKHLVYEEGGRYYITDENQARFEAERDNRLLRRDRSKSQVIASQSNRARRNQKQ